MYSLERFVGENKHRALGDLERDPGAWKLVRNFSDDDGKDAHRAAQALRDTDGFPVVRVRHEFMERDPASKNCGKRMNVTTWISHRTGYHEKRKHGRRAA